jgi:hypothetical protein
MLQSFQGNHRTVRAHPFTVPQVLLESPVFKFPLSLFETFFFKEIAALQIFKTFE